MQAHLHIHVWTHPPVTNCFKKAYVWIFTPTVVLESPCIKQQTNVLLSVCELPVWAKYCVCSAPEIWILSSFFQPVLNLIFLTSLGTQQSSYTTLALYNLSLRDSPNHKTSSLPSSVLPICRKRWSEKLGCAWSPVAWPTAAFVWQWF